LVLEALSEKARPKLIISGAGLRVARERLEGLESRLTPSTLPATLDPRIVDCSAEFSGSIPPWFFKPTSRRAKGARKFEFLDRGLHLSIHASVKKLDDACREVKLIVANESPNSTSCLLNFGFTIKLQGCRVHIPSPDELSKRKARKEDVPLFVETVNCTAELSEDLMKIVLSPVGVYDQKRVIPVQGPTWDYIVENPIPEGTEIDEEFAQHFKHASRIVSMALKKILGEGESRSHKFQYDARKYLYSGLSKIWKQPSTQGLIIPTPPATGKSEINFDIAIVAALVAKRLHGDVGTVSGISEPLRALTAEQMERLFQLLAYVNEQLPSEERLTLGFYMGKIPYQPSPDIGSNDVPISRCPFCEKQLSFSYSSQYARLIPECPNCNRKFDWVYLTVVETESFLPNIIMATLDKLCYQESRNLNVHAFFGREYVRCAKCNRIRVATRAVREGRGACWHCNSSLDPATARKSFFSVFVIDEPHAFSGSAGSYAGMYTAAELALVKNASDKGVLVIGSSATIRQGDMLLRHLAGCSDVKIFPDSSEVDQYFEEINEPHRRFIFISPCITNRRAIPKAIVTTKEWWEKVRRPDDPEKIPQVVFTMKRAEAENVRNDLVQEGYVQNYQLAPQVIHGEEKRAVIENVLSKLEKCQLDVLITTLDLIALGINIPSISVVHFDGMPWDYAKFVQGYSRSARAPTDTALIFVWLRPNVPPESYYLVHYRDLFLYRNSLIPIVPINRWFPESVKNYVPAGALQYSLFTDPNASYLNSTFAARQFSGSQFEVEFQGFMGSVMSDNKYPEDFDIAMRATLKGLQTLKNHLRVSAPQIQRMKNSAQLLERILPKGIRGNKAEIQIAPRQVSSAMVSSRVAETLRSAGLAYMLPSEEEPDEQPLEE